MNISEIASAFAKGKISLQQAVQKLDALGYTRQERRRIIKGAVRARQLRNEVRK